MVTTLEIAFTFVKGKRITFALYTVSYFCFHIQSSFSRNYSKAYIVNLNNFTVLNVFGCTYMTYLL